MSRYIDADAYIEKYECWGYLDEISVERFNEITPTADVVSREIYDELNDRYHRLLESANILADVVRDYERREDAEIH